MSRNQRIRKERKLALIEQERFVRKKRISVLKRAAEPVKSQERFGTIYPFSETSGTTQEGRRNKVFNKFLRYAEPLLKLASDPASVESAVKLSVVCWNFAVLPQEQQEAEKRQFLARYGGLKELDTTIENMLLRKMLQFGDDYYLIEKYQVTQRENLMDLTITYKKIEKMA